MLAQTIRYTTHSPHYHSMGSYPGLCNCMGETCAIIKTIVWGCTTPSSYAWWLSSHLNSSFVSLAQSSRTVPTHAVLMALVSQSQSRSHRDCCPWELALSSVWCAPLYLTCHLQQNKQGQVIQVEIIPVLHLYIYRLYAGFKVTTGVRSLRKPMYRRPKHVARGRIFWFSRWSDLCSHWEYSV